MKEMWFTAQSEPMAHVACGDPVSFDTDYRELLNDRLCARGLDDRLGGYIILEAAKKAKERGCTCGIYAATTVGEELTKHGAAWCASRIAPTLAVVLDVTYTSDYEGTRAIENGEILLGGGPVFLHNSFSHKMVVERLKKAARNVHIKYQWENGCEEPVRTQMLFIWQAGGYLQQLCPYLFAICIIRQKCAVWRMCRDVLTCLRNFYVESGLIFV